MTPSPPPLSRVKELFSLALEIPPGPERDAFLTLHCGPDTALRAHLDELLAAALRTSGLNPPDTSSPTLIPLSEAPGSRIGPYKLLEQIGEGGFGVVFMAEQERPLRRRVALKIVKLGMDTRQVVARFEAERQALAMMDHPNIARVFDAGSTDTGRPYFVMELVRGIPITRYCDEHRMSIPSRLALFADVCSAVHHAHQKGIIHRDLKPNNVLVELHDGKPVPKVIDFGIAKATQSRLTDKTLFTEFRQLIGTPAYMSPEQAQLSGLDIDTRSDVYSLGVLLYELLTGSTPFDARELLSAAFDEMRRIIREVDPPAPSTRLTSTATNTASPSSLATIASSRAADPIRLTSTVRGELDWIVLKCLEKDRTRRYDSAAALATDLNHYLHDEPVSAGAPDTLYIARKFIRRHRLPVLAASAVAAALLLGTVGTTIALIGQSRANSRAQLERDRAISSEAIAKSNESRALAGEAEARKQSDEARRQSAIAEAVVQFQSTLLSSADPTRNLGDKVTVLQAVSAAAAELDKGLFKTQPLVEARIRDTIGMTLRYFAKFPESQKQLRTALDLRRAHLPGNHLDIAWSAGSLGNLLSDMGEYAAAESLFRECLDIRRKALPPNDPLIARAARNLGDNISYMFRHDEACTLIEESVQIYRQSNTTQSREELIGTLYVLSKTYSAMRRFDDAERTAREAVAVARANRPANHPEIGMTLSQLAAVQLELGHLNDAELTARECLAIVTASYPPGHPGVCGALNVLSSILTELGRPAEAEPLSRQSLAILEKAYGPSHPSIVNALYELCEVLDALGRTPETIPLQQRAIDIVRNANPDDVAEPATTYNNRAVLLEQKGQLADAEVLYRKSIVVADHHRDRLAAAVSRRHLGGFLSKYGRFAEAQPLLEEAVAAQKQFRTPDHPEIAITLQALAFNHFIQQRYAEAEPLYRNAAEILAKTLLPTNPRLISAQTDLANTLFKLGRNQDADTLYTSVISQLRPTLPPGSPLLANTLVNHANNLYDLRQFDRAEPLYRESLATHLARSPSNPFDSALAQQLLGRCLLAQNRPADAIPFLDSALATFTEKLPPEAAPLASIRIVRGRCLTALSRFEEAESSLLASEKALQTAQVPLNNVMYIRLNQDLAALYSAWNTASPDPTRDQKRSKYQALLASYSTPPAPPPTTAPAPNR